MTTLAEDIEECRDELYKLLQKEREYAKNLTDKFFEEQLKLVQDSMCAKMQALKNRAAYYEILLSSGLDIGG